MTRDARHYIKFSPKCLSSRGFPFPIVVNDEDDTPNAVTRAVLDRDMAGLEPSYGPFDSTEKMLNAALVGGEKLHMCTHIS